MQTESGGGGVQAFSSCEMAFIVHERGMRIAESLVASNLRTGYVESSEADQVKSSLVNGFG